MARNFAIAFGGTGARCLEALLYLAASRELEDPVHVLVIDPDKSNGNVTTLKRQLGHYKRIQARLRPAGSPEVRPLFATEINPGRGKDSFVWEYPNVSASFQDLIHYRSLGVLAERDMLDLLYDEDDLAMTFGEGYVGRAHVGSMDLMRTLDRAAQTAHRRAAAEAAGALGEPIALADDALQVLFRDLRAAAQGQGGANVVVIGSVFGGTGASGLPIIPTLVERAVGGTDGNVNLACVALAPYFTFAKGGKGDPDSRHHMLATQAALYHYAFTSAGYHRSYLIGAPDRSQTNDHNFRGGPAQENIAHYVELGAALAAQHAFATPPPDEHMDEVWVSNSEQVHWDRLPCDNRNQLRRDMTVFATFSLMHAALMWPDLKNRYHTGMLWATRLKKDCSTPLNGTEGELTELREFSARFLEWCTQIETPAEVQLFQIPPDWEAVHQAEQALGNLVVGAPSPPKPEGYYHDIMTNLNVASGTGQTSPVGWYVTALSGAVERFCVRHYSADARHHS